MLIGALLCVHGVHIGYDGVVVQAAVTATAVAVARVTAMCLGSCDHPLEVGGWVQGAMQLLGLILSMIFPYTDTRVLSSREGDSK